MEQIKIKNVIMQEQNIQEESVPKAATAVANPTEAAAATMTEKVMTKDTQPADQPSKEPKVKQQFNGNLLYEENLGFIPVSLRGIQDPRYVIAKFKKDYKHFDFFNEDILEKLEEMDLHRYLRLLQISRPSKYIDIMFKIEDAANFFMNQYIEVRGKPLPFI